MPTPSEQLQSLRLQRCGALETVPIEDVIDRLLHIQSIRQPLLVDVRDAAKQLGMSRSTFLKLHNSGRVPLPLRFGRVVRWRVEELQAWVTAGCPGRDAWKWPT